MSTNSKAKSRVLVAAVAAASMFGPASALAGQDRQSRPATGTTALATVNWQIPLGPSAAFPRSRGSAQYQSQPGQSEFQVEVERLRMLAGRSVTISVNGAAVGRAKVSSRGIAQLDRNSELGQKVPAIAHGATVRVRSSAGKLVAWGRF